MKGHTDLQTQKGPWRTVSRNRPPTGGTQRLNDLALQPHCCPAYSTLSEVKEQAAQLSTEVRNLSGIMQAVAHGSTKKIKRNAKISAALASAPRCEGSDDELHCSTYFSSAASSSVPIAIPSRKLVYRT